jgi:two-component system, chemotaxis family, CheB/CheR fusion protein
MDRSSLHILVVDDDPDAAASLVEVLTAEGYVTSAAVDGAAALAAIARDKPHCVLLDIDMPRMSGHELGRSLRDAYGDEIVLIAVTGRSPQDRVVQETFAIVDHYLTKPIDFEALHRVLSPG